MLDIHTHILPVVDDGAENEMMSLLMLLRAKEQGITHIFATPTAALLLKWLYENTEHSYADAIGFENAEQLLCTAANKKRNGG